MAAVAWPMTGTAVAGLVLIFGLLLSIGVVVIVAAGAIYSKREADRLRQQLNHLEGTNTDWTTSLQQLTKERDAAIEGLAIQKREHAFETLRWFAGTKINGNKPTVTIRFFSYGSDYSLVTRIERIVAEQLGWPVTLDGANIPALPRADRFKVIFTANFVPSFEHVGAAFYAGDYLECRSVGPKTMN